MYWRCALGQYLLSVTLLQSTHTSIYGRDNQALCGQVWCSHRAMYLCIIMLG